MNLLKLIALSSGLADSVRNSEVYQCRLQPTDFVRGNVDLKTCGWWKTALKLLSISWGYC